MIRNLAIRNPAFLGAVCGSGCSASFIDTTSMTLWFDAALGATLSGSPCANGDNVDSWENQISTTDALQGTAADQPSYHTGVINGLPVIRFDLSNTEWLDVAHGADTNIVNPMTYFGLIKFAGFGSFNVPFSKNASGASSQYSFYTNVAGFAGRLYLCIGTSTCFDTGAFSCTAGVWHRIIWTSSATTRNLWVDGVNYLTGGGTTPTANVQSARIGQRIDGLYADMDLAEMGLFNREISGAEVTALDDYLACKYDL